jgi:DNA-binding CsgD family transcriptional regulator
MKKIYTGKFLTICCENNGDRFVQYWKSSPDSIAEFKNEMLEYVNLYKEFKPSQSLWLQKKFKLSLDEQTQLWIEEKVNIPCKKLGNEKLAFVVSKDVMAHIKVINSFEEIHSCIEPKHFSSEEKARKWLDNEFSMNINNQVTKIIFEGLDKEGYSTFKIKTTGTDVAKTIRAFKDIIKTNDFVRLNVDKFITLTKREREVLALYTKGVSLKEIPDELYISYHTVRTHIKNIKRKLQITSSEKLLEYGKAFNPRISKIS